ncbi:MAG TPA: sugar transferase [Bryobacteraceae bacterium]|jgi:sugar transferase (PEP-CTERM system associated)|nr:sugar transferase [Bryobacteraceae bacterium]
MTRIFRVFVPATAVVLLISEILLITSAFIVAVYLTLDVSPWVNLMYDGGMMHLIPVLITILVGMHFNDLYSQFYVKSRIVLLQQLCLVMGGAFVVQGLLSYIVPDLRVSAHVMAVGSALAVVVIYFWRVLFSTFAISVMGRNSLLMVGGSPLLEDIAAHIQEHPELGLEVAGYVDDAHQPGDALRGAKVLGTLPQLREIVQATNPSRIVVGMSERRNRMPVAELLELRFSGRIIEEAAAAFERVCGRVCLKELRPSQLIYSGELGPRPQNLIVQTVSNRIIAAVGLVVASPIMAITALAVKFSSPGPILYRQVRVGMDDVPFTVYKFRSMRVDAEATTGAVTASKDDPRVTRVGRIIRKIRFDELPQLYNTLKGDMSIVGPRPERPEFVRELSLKIPYYRQRHCVRPGITGWAQVNFKYGETLEDTITKLEYDLYYIKNMSLSLDTYIIFHTVKTMLLSRGAQ